MKNQKFTHLFNALATLSCCALLAGSTCFTAPISNTEITTNIANELNADVTDGSIGCMPLNDNKPLGGDEV